MSVTETETVYVVDLPNLTGYRDLCIDYHPGQWSAMYALASSGTVLPVLIHEIELQLAELPIGTRDHNRFESMRRGALMYRAAYKLYEDSCYRNNQEPLNPRKWAEQGYPSGLSTRVYRIGDPS